MEFLEEYKRLYIFLYQTKLLNEQIDQLKEQGKKLTRENAELRKKSEMLYLTAAPPLPVTVETALFIGPPFQTHRQTP
ncbi:hypothetical protein SASPL_112966 [Salvia splendens]|uniref:Uncharacterized protein n=1 Tax=Salvia splendens TaxID=180675 RepID=A0A8X8YB56_SALSN|nr:hypothetical protein SASPL_112966 [Salvia splendens]